jgi:DNA-binding response OmpR family regulator
MKRKILVVEDEVLIAMQIKSVLEEQGYNVVINIYPDCADVLRQCV